MAIIYSYTKTNEAYGSDLLVLSRFQGSANADNGRNYSIDLGTLGAFIIENYASDLNSVLTAGNTSLLDAKIGSIYLYNSFEPATLGYVSITGDKNAFNFFSVQGTKYAQIYNGGIFLKGIDTTFGTNIQAPDTPTATRTATFQDASGTIAYLSDIQNTGSGLYSQIANSNMVTNTTTKTLLTGTGAGTLEVPADTFAVGDSYEINLIGEITCNNSATLRITLENTEGVVFGDTGVMDLSSATGKNWFLDAIFTVRSIGGETVADIICGGNFSYNVNSGNSSESFSFASGNPNDFDTTISNELKVFVQWGAATPSDKIVSFIFNLNKIY